MWIGTTRHPNFSKFSTFEFEVFFSELGTKHLPLIMKTLKQQLSYRLLGWVEENIQLTKKEKIQFCLSYTKRIPLTCLI